MTGETGEFDEFETPTGRTQRMPSAERRKQMLAAAVDKFERGELDVDLDSLNLDDLIRTADAPRSSIRRIWTSNEAFYLDLMETMVEPARVERSLLGHATAARAQAVVEQYQDRMGDPAGRRAVLREAVRQALEYNFESTHQSRAWRLYAGLTAALPALSVDHHRRARDILASADARDLKQMAEFYEDMLQVFGLKFRDGLDADIFAAAVAAMNGGLVLRRFMNESATGSIMLDGIDGDPVKWHPAAVGFLAVMDGMTEPDPQWMPKR